MLHHKRRGEKHSEQQPADPPGDGRPQKPDLILMDELKEKNAGGDQRSAGKQEARAQDQGDAVLGALEADEGYGGEDESENPGGDLQIALQDGVGAQDQLAQPVSGQENQDEARGVQQDALVLATFEYEVELAHDADPVPARPDYIPLHLLDAKAGVRVAY
jgi:hypothetical protein